ncbi:MAG: methionyl-tRNA formyltransferase-like protein [Burkholderiales bacterium]|nr:methionyl-tRNA formyltransferase-like protein [Phycisphaerae bacterium]
MITFREETFEPPFLDDIRQLTESIKGRFVEAKNVGHADLAGLWQGMTIDLLFAISWRYMIPRAVFQKARLGAYVIHDSLLPQYRGFAPTVWAVVNGESQTGATLFEIADGVDEGRIIGQQSVPVGPDETIRNVMDRVTEAYLQLIKTHLPSLIDGTAGRTVQDESVATYTCKRTPEDNQINWDSRSDVILNLIRGVTRPYSGAYTFLNGNRLVIWSASRIEKAPRYVGRVPGRVVEIRPGHGTVVLTRDGCIILQSVQADNSPEACAADIVNRLSMTLGR